MPFRFVPVVILALAGASAADAADLAWTHVTVRIYDTAGLSPGERDSALTLAASTLATVSVETRFLTCGAADPPSPGCESPLATGEMAIRIVRSPFPHGGREAFPLGEALIDVPRGRAVFATVYLDRVLWLARSAGTDACALLGRAVAHELGHLLMASTSHGAHGLMRAVWSRDELRRDRGSDWGFTPPDAAAIRRRTRPLLALAASRPPG